MARLEQRPAGSTFRRPGGREGWWRRPALARRPDLARDADDEVVCPYEFVECPGAEAQAALAELRLDHPGKTPILFGSPHETGIMLERRTNRGKSADEWLRETERFDLEAWFAARVIEWNMFQAASGGAIPRRGAWPRRATRHHALCVPFDTLTDAPKPSVIIGLLPTRDPTETAAYLGFGGWNDCPPPPVHILLARRWHEVYGAVQVANTYETVEFQVAKPLTDRDQALRLALDQFYWCSDSVPDTLQVAAAELIGSSVWVFWWD